MQIAFLIPLLTLASSIAAAQTQDRPAGPTLRFEQVEIREALMRIFRGRGSFVLDPKVHGKVSGTATATSLEDVAALARQVDATAQLNDGIVLVRHAQGGKRPKPPQEASERTIDFSFKNVPLATAVRALFTMANEGRVASAETRTQGKVDLTGSFATFDEAIRTVADSANAALVIAGSRYLVVDAELWGDLDWGASNAVVAMTQADIRDVLRQLFRQVNVNYTVAPDVQGVISCDLHGPFLEVLTRLLAAGNSYYRIESGVVQILAIGRTEHRSASADSKPTPQVFMIMPDRIRNVIVPLGLGFKQVPVSQALSQLFARLAFRYQLTTPLNGTVTADVGGLTLVKALETLLAGQPVQVEWAGDKFVLRRAPGVRRISIGGGPLDWLNRQREDPVGWVTKG